MKDVVLCLTTYNRFDILKESIESLSKTNFPDNCKIIIKDDCSTDIRVKSFLDNLKLPIPIILCYNDTNLGCDLNVLSCIDKGFKITTENFVFVLDSDALYHPDWLNKTIEMIEEVPNMGMGTTFNTPKHKVKIETEKYLEKESLGGFCVALNKFIYDKIPKDIEWDWKGVNICRSLGYKMITTKESYIEHVGAIGTHSKLGSGKIGDKADNFVGDITKSNELRKEKTKY